MNHTTMKPWNKIARGVTGALVAWVMSATPASSSCGWTDADLWPEVRYDCVLDYGGVEGTLRITNYATMTIRAGGALNINFAEGGVLLIQPGSTIILEPGARISDLGNAFADHVSTAPIPETGETHIMNGDNAQLGLLDPSGTASNVTTIGDAAGVEINNMGYRSADGLLYAMQLTPTGNFQIVAINNEGAVLALGRPPELPWDLRFDAGDVSTDGTTMYLGFLTVGNQAFYSLDLTGVPTLPAVTQIPVLGEGEGDVHDLAYHSADGLLYGGDSTDGELAVLDPVTGVRADFAVPGLPAGGAFGGAWFGGAGNLFLYRNLGEIYEIDLSGPAIVNVESAPAYEHVDGASRPQFKIGAALRMTTTDEPGALSKTVELDYVFENLDSTGLSNLTAPDNLEDVFGEHGVDWTLTSIVSTPVDFANPSFDGHATFELIDRDPPQDLAAGASATVTVTLELLTHAALPANGYYSNQVTVVAKTAAGGLVGDVSTAGDDPAPAGNPGAHLASTLGEQAPLDCDSGPFVIHDEDAQLNRIELSTPDAEYSLTPIGPATGREINNLGFRRTDGLLYGIQLNPDGNDGIVQIDGAGTLFELGRPVGLPAEPRFAAGDVTPDGTAMYVTAHAQPLYKVALTRLPKLPAATSVAITGASGYVMDWAAHPDGRLYGGDSTHGQLAVLDPDTGIRTDYAVAGLPSGSSFGGAWIGADGHLFLLRNSGEVYEIDVGTRTIVGEVRIGDSSTRNDGAACFPAA